MNSPTENEPPSTSPPAFRVLDVWSDTFEELRANAGPILRAVLVPALLIAAFDLVAQPATQGGVVEASAPVRALALLASMVVGVLLAVSCHRIVLRDPDELGHPWGIYFDPRVGAYLVTLIVLILLFIAAFAVTGVLPLIVSFEYPVIGSVLLGVAFLLCLYGMMRLSLLLPARAIGEPVSFDAVLRWTRGRSVRAVFASAFPLFVLGLVLGPLDRLMMAGPDRFGFRFLPTAVGALAAGVLAAVLLSCTYRAIRPSDGDDAPTVTGSDTSP